MGFLILGIVIVAVLILIVADAYNRLATLRNRYKNAFSQVDIQLQRRYDLLPQLVEVIKNYFKEDHELLEAVIHARQQAITASRQAAQAPGDPQAMQQLSQAEIALIETLRRLFALAEAHHSLKVDPSWDQLIAELRFTENHIGTAQQAFNQAVSLYRRRRERFPSSLVASSFSFPSAAPLNEPLPTAQKASQLSL